MSAGGPSRREALVVGPTDEGRLDAWLSDALGLSRSRVVGLVEKGLVEVDGARPRKSQAVSPGQRVVVEIPPPVEISAEPQDLPLDVVYEDASLLVVNKAAGMVVHPSAGHPSGTLVNALLYRVRDLSGIGGALRPGIVHRLDRDTSGLMVVAKEDRVHRALSDALKRREVRRLYLAASWGHLPSTPLTIDAPVGRHPTDRKRMAVVEGGRRALTRVRVLEDWLAAQFLQVKLGTGRTHQIRVHLAHVGHPIVGDDVYGAGRHKGMTGTGRSWAAELARRVPRQFLHAARLEFEHPVSGEHMSFEAPLPSDLADAAAWARGTP